MEQDIKNLAQIFGPYTETYFWLALGWTAPLQLESFHRDLRGVRSAVLVC